MTRTRRLSAFAGLLALCGSTHLWAEEIKAEAARPQILRSYGNLPLSFEVNQGQADSGVRFLSHAGGSSLHLTQTEAILTLRRNPTSKERVRGKLWDLPMRAPETRDVVHVKLVGANPAPRIEGVSELPGKSNYFIGNDPKNWRTNIANYARVEYRDVYPGVSLAYYGNQRQLEYDLIVAPGADPGVIRLAFEGVQNVRLDEQGDLVLRTAGGKIVQHKPLVYQEADGVKKEISGSYVIGRRNQVSLRIAGYDPSKPLVIDPVLSYSTYLGGHCCVAEGIAVDSSGSAYITGDFYGEHVFVTKLNPAGSAVLYSTLLAGDVNIPSTAHGVAVDSAGNAYVTGVAGPGFPTTSGAFQPLCPSGGSYCGAAFITKLNGTGSVLYSTYLGDTSDGRAIAVDSAGNVYVTGVAGPVFPTTPGAFQPTAPNGASFMTKLNATGSALVYSTYLGNGGDIATGITLDSAGNAYVTGFAHPSFSTTPGAFQPTAPDGAAFVAKLNAAGSALVYSTYLGNGGDIGTGIALDSAGNAYVTGAAGPAFPTTPGAFRSTYISPWSLSLSDTFVTKLNAAGSALVYSTYLASAYFCTGCGVSPRIAVDSAGHAYVMGWTWSDDFPTVNAFQATLVGPTDAFITKLNAGGSALVYSSYLGGNDEVGDIPFGVAVDGSGNAYVTGVTDSYNSFPVTTGSTVCPHCGGGGLDPFVTKISAADTATPAAGQSVTVSTVPGVPGDAGISATLTNNGGGTPTVTAESFPSNPGTADIIDLGGRYVDLKVTDATLADSVTAQFYYPSTVTGSAESHLRLFYFTGPSWRPVRSSNNSIPAKNMNNNLDGTVSGGRFTVVFDATSTPKITELTGTVFTSSVAVSYSVCLLFDPTRPNKSGSTVPIKLQICDPDVGNLSSSDVVVTALGVKLVSNNAPGALQDPGNANPDSNFRYDSTLGGTGGYIYNLSTKGFSTGTYALSFKAGADKLIHSVQFEVK
jgi:hypothetical protein